MKSIYVAVSLVMAALLVLSACGGKAGPEEPIPSRSNFLASVRLSEILGDPDLNTLIGTALVGSVGVTSLEKALEEAAEESGIDPRLVNRLLLFGDINSDEYIGVFMEGTFDQSELLPAFEAAEGPLSEDRYRGHEIFTSSDGATILSFLESGKILVGGPQAVRDAIDVREGAASALTGPVLETFEDLGDPWVKASFVFPEETFSEEELLDLGDVPIPGLNLEIFTGIQSVGLSLDKSRDVFELDVALNYPDENSAESAAEAFDGLIGFARAFVDVEGLTQLLAKIDIAAAGSSVNIGYSTTAAELQSAIEALGQLGGVDLFGAGTDLFGEEEISAPVPVTVVPAAPTTAPGGIYVPSQGRDHIPTGQRARTYNSNPPTSGEHWSEPGIAPAPWGIYGQIIPDEVLVHNLEHGGIVIHYRPTVEPSVVNQLKEFVQSLPNYPAGYILAPRENLPANITLSAWEYYLPLFEHNEQFMRGFVSAHYDQGPEELAGGPR